jgi:hypothetical protein
LPDRSLTPPYQHQVRCVWPRPLSASLPYHDVLPAPRETKTENGAEIWVQYFAVVSAASVSTLLPIHLLHAHHRATFGVQSRDCAVLLVISVSVSAHPPECTLVLLFSCGISLSVAASRQSGRRYPSKNIHIRLSYNIMTFLQIWTLSVVEDPRLRATFPSGNRARPSTRLPRSRYFLDLDGEVQRGDSSRGIYIGPTS